MGEILSSLGFCLCCPYVHIVGKVQHKHVNVKWCYGVNSGEKEIVGLDGVHESSDSVIRAVSVE